MFPLIWQPPDSWSYSYLLGMYLGDGCISANRRTYRLVITCDAAYPTHHRGLLGGDDASDPLPDRCACNPHRGATLHARRGDSKRWPEAFPQHGPGRKHDRKIELAPWQREFVDRFPQEFLRGLLHSDGCRTVNRFKTKLPSGRVAEYAYPRWFFSNRSDDIRGLFCEYCERLGIRWTQSNPRNISVSHRTASRCWIPSSRRRADGGTTAWAVPPERVRPGPREALLRRARAGLRARPPGPSGATATRQRTWRP